MVRAAGKAGRGAVRQGRWAGEVKEDQDETLRRHGSAVTGRIQSALVTGRFSSHGRPGERR